MKMNSMYFIIAFIVVGATMLIMPSPTMAQSGLIIDQVGFNPNMILTDDDIFNPDGVSYEYMVNFAKSKGKMADILVVDIDGQMKTPVDIIWRASQTYRMNPRYLLALIQKEQSLVEDPNPSERRLDWAAGYGVCDSCSKDDPRIQDFKGFANQIEYAAKQHRERYMQQLLTTGKTIGGKGIGISMMISGIEIIPQNKATAMLYTYTPHVHGNLVLWRIWQRWFSQSFLNGTIVRAMPSQEVYMIQNRQKRKFLSEAVLLSMTNPDKIIEASETALASYPEGEPMRFPQYSLLRDPDGAIYLLAQDGKRRIANMETFRQFGFNEDEIIEVLFDEIDHLATAQPITQQTVFPQGALVKAPDKSTVWYVESNKKYSVPDEVFLKVYFTRRPIVNVPQLTIDTYADAGEYKFHEGELIKGSDPTVYVLESSQLRPIPTEEVFLGMGWKWHNIITVPDRVLLSYNIGEVLNLGNLATIPTVSTATE
jgi:hypothetical protein